MAISKSSAYPLADICDVVEVFKRGAVLAGFPHEVETVDGLTPEESTALHDEKTNRWKQPWQIYYVAIISSMAAVVQGMEYVVFSLCHQVLLN